MNLLLYQITYLVIALGCLIFIISLFQRNKGSILNYKAHIYFILTSLAIASWAIGRYFLLILDSKEMAFLWAEILTLSHVLIYTFFVHFILSSFNVPQKRSRFFKIIFHVFVVFAGLAFFADVFLGTNFLISGVSSKLFFPWYETAGSIHYIFLIYPFLALLYSGWEIILYSIKNKESGGLQIILMAIIMTLGFLGGNTSFFLVYDINIQPLGVPLVIVQFLSTFYYLARYRFSDLRAVARNIYANIAVVFFVFILFLSGHFLINFYLAGFFTLSGMALTILFSLIFIILFYPIVNYVLKDSEFFLFKRFNFKKVAKDLTSDFNSAKSLNDVLKRLKENISKFLMVENINIIIFKEYTQNSEILHTFKGKPLKKDVIENENFKKNLKKGEIIIPQKSINFNKYFLEIIEKNNIKLIVPLNVGGAFLGVVVLGEKLSKENYSIEDIEFLEIIITQASSVANKNLLSGKVENLSNNLSKKVKNQRKNLKQQTAHLEKVLTMRSEFLDIASHQLRTPVTAISGALSMLLDGSIKDSKKEKQFLKSCFEKSIQLTDIIDDILRASTMDTEKLKLNLEAIDIKDLLVKIYNSKKEEVENEKIKFSLETPDKKPAKVISDKRYLEEAITNLINNAVQYTKKGFIKIKLEEDWQKNKVFVKIIDSGIGIPKEDQENLFKKFVRAKNADKAFANGSGLGLFIIKQVVDSQDGLDIYLEESKVGKGSIFTLEIPMVS